MAFGSSVLAGDYENGKQVISCLHATTWSSDDNNNMGYLSALIDNAVDSDYIPARETRAR